MNTPQVHEFTKEPNECRADWAQRALDTFISTPGAEEETALRDLLADLMHLCDRRRNKPNRNFEQELQSAKLAYQAEIEQNNMCIAQKS